MLYKLLRSHPASIDDILRWNKKSSVNDFIINETIKLFVKNPPSENVALSLPTRKYQGYCNQAFIAFIVGYDESHLCCSGWQASKSIGNPSKEPLKEIWNSEQAKAFRKSIIDGSYRYCLDDTCPFLSSDNNNFPRLEQYPTSIQNDIIRGDGVMSHGPAFLNCGFDMSCNLSCPSCRSEKIIEVGERADNIKKIENKIEEIGSFFHNISISGSGDPFGSPYSKRFLKRINSTIFPNLKNINLHCNGQLFTQRNWEQLPQIFQDSTISAEISLDGSTKKTIECNRRGVIFEKLLTNLKFIAKLRNQQKINSLKFSFVVQDNNFHEMSDFVELCVGLNADFIIFTKIVNWGTFTEEEYAKKAVHMKTHPNHHALVEVINNENLKNRIVMLGNLEPLLYDER